MRAAPGRGSSYSQSLFLQALFLAYCVALFEWEVIWVKSGFGCCAQLHIHVCFSSAHDALVVRCMHISAKRYLGGQKQKYKNTLVALPGFLVCVYISSALDLSFKITFVFR